MYNIFFSERSAFPLTLRTILEEKCSIQISKISIRVKLSFNIPNFDNTFENKFSITPIVKPKLIPFKLNDLYLITKLLTPARRTDAVII